jgi:transcriptional regulator with XRE-family HTH domain
MSGDTPALVSDDDRAWQELGRRLREAREYLGFSQSEVADALGLPRPAISRFETGQRKVSVLELARLAALYRRTPDYFIDAPEPVEDETVTALFRATRALSERDRTQVLRFAEFLRGAGPPPEPGDETQ